MKPMKPNDRTFKHAVYIWDRYLYQPEKKDDEHNWGIAIRIDKKQTKDIVEELMEKFFGARFSNKITLSHYYQCDLYTNKTIDYVASQLRIIGKLVKDKSVGIDLVDVFEEVYVDDFEFKKNILNLDIEIKKAEREIQTVKRLYKLEVYGIIISTVIEATLFPELYQ